MVGFSLMKISSCSAERQAAEDQHDDAATTIGMIGSLRVEQRS